MRWRDPKIHWKGGHQRIPKHTHECLVRYIENGEDPYDDFFDALLTNDLKGAVLGADEKNLPALPHIVGWLYNYAPAACFGSREKVLTWKTKGGLAGQGLLEVAS